MGTTIWQALWQHIKANHLIPHDPGGLLLGVHPAEIHPYVHQRTHKNVQSHTEHQNKMSQEAHLGDMTFLEALCIP